MLGVTFPVFARRERRAKTSVFLVSVYLQVLPAAARKGFGRANLMIITPMASLRVAKVVAGGQSPP